MKFKMYLNSFIPRHISNRVVVRVYHILSWIRVPRSIREKNYRHNLKHLGEMDREVWRDSTVCIEDQAQWEAIQFGAGSHHNMSYSGCEIIAVFNAVWLGNFGGDGGPDPQI